MIDAFQYFDSDGSGKLDQKELYASFSGACPFYVSEEAFTEIFASSTRTAMELSRSTSLWPFS